jgi:hypothetical protein
VSCGDLLGHAAGHQLAQHGVEPARNLVLRPAQVPVPPRPYPQHRRVIIGCHRAAGPGAQRRDGNRQGVVRVVLVTGAGGQQPDPGAQLGLHVQHPLADSDQLLGQQVPQPAGALDRPGALRPRRRPRHQPLRLAGRGTHPQPAQRLLRRIDRHRGVRPLVRVHADHHCRHQHAPSPRSMDEPAAGMPNYSAGARPSFEPRHGETRQAGTSL